MTLTRKLARVAALVAASGCGGATATSAGPADGAPDALPGPGDAASDSSIDTGMVEPGDTGIGSPQDAAPDTSCFGPCCNPNVPPPKQVSAAEACQMMEEVPYISQFLYGPTCGMVCGSAYQCMLPNDYVAQVQALNPDGGVLSSDGSTGQTLVCPTTASMVVVSCVQNCTGRLTQGYSAPERRALHDGERLAAMAYLEAVSVHAFRRLERELAAHAAPPDLLRRARRARRDEVRHTAMTSRLARARGGSPRLPAAPSAQPVRSLFEIALENAVEGCVRETYGALAGLVEAQTSADASLRLAMRSIAADECRHAELAWAVHAWALARLSDAQRRRIESAMSDAVAEIGAHDPRGAALLFTEAGTAVA
jgi:hypothetical protein